MYCTFNLERSYNSVQAMKLFWTQRRKCKLQLRTHQRCIFPLGRAHKGCVCAGAKLFTVHTQWVSSVTNTKVPPLMRLANAAREIKCKQHSLYTSTTLANVQRR